MTTARSIVRGALTFGLNRLSPGEAEDADLFSRCLDALNDVVDEFNGIKSMLFREVLTSGTVTTSAPTLGTTWASLSPGDEILGASLSDGTILDSLTVAQYQAIRDKTQAGTPYAYAHDGLATVYVYPVPSSAVVVLRTRQAVTEFADLDTDYSMPKGYRSALSDLLAEKMAPSMLGGVTPSIASKAASARSRLAAQAINPAILDVGRMEVFDILRGW